MFLSATTWMRAICKVVLLPVHTELKILFTLVMTWLVLAIWRRLAAFDSRGCGRFLVDILWYYSIRILLYRVWLSDWGSRIDIPVRLQRIRIRNLHTQFFWCGSVCITSFLLLLILHVSWVFCDWLGPVKNIFINNKIIFLI